MTSATTLNLAEKEATSRLAIDQRPRRKLEAGSWKLEATDAY
jgi:hypothetical protein